MVNLWFTRWSLALVLVVLIVALVATATVVMAGAVLQPKVVPRIVVQPSVVRPGEVVVVTGEGWPGLANLVLVVALSPTRDLLSECLLPVGATTVSPDGRLAATFIFPADLPWSALREAWVVVRPGTGNLQAVARLVVAHPRPTPTPTIAAAATPIPNRPQIQGLIAHLALNEGLLTLRPLDGTPDRGVAVASAAVRRQDGWTAALTDLRVGMTISAEGWFDSGGTLIAEQITILEVTGQVEAPLVPAEPTPCAPVVVAPAPTVGVAVVPIAVATSCPVVPVVAPTCAPPRPTPAPTAVGVDRWVGEFFCSPELTGLPAFVREAEVIDFDWWLGPPISGLPREGYAVRWTGQWSFPRTCRYRFRLLLKGAARLSVDGRVLLDLWDSPPPAEYQADADLGAGVHALQLEFRSTGPKARVQLRWEYAGAVP